MGYARAGIIGLRRYRTWIGDANGIEYGTKRLSDAVIPDNNWELVLEIGVNPMVSPIMAWV